MSQEKPPIQVLIADDHPMLREGIAGMIQLQPDMALAGEATNGAEAIDAYRRLKPDVTLMDLQMPGTNGLQAIKAIREDFPAARIIVLTTYDGDAQALNALKAGAAGYLLKSAGRTELVDTIRAIHAGRRHVPPEIAQEIALHAAEEALSGREIDVLRFLASGKSNKEIARSLSLSDQTVKAHITNMFAKLDVNDRTQAVTVAIKRGIITL